MAKQDTQRNRRQHLKIEAFKDSEFHMDILWGEDTHQAVLWLSRLFIACAENNTRLTTWK
ncbi:hypothetical protein SLIQ_20840 [Serratia liquefaciens FK01]|nr:hypothetical protein SLIQ_20840 [Serratia liquefaciens FK01]